MKQLNEIKEFLIYCNPRLGRYTAKEADKCWEVAMLLMHRVEACESTLGMIALTQTHDVPPAAMPAINTIKEMAVRRLNDG